MPLKLALTTPIEETTTTTEVRLKKVTINIVDDGQHYGIAELREGQLDGETFTEHRLSTVRLDPENLGVEFAKAVTDGDTYEQALLKAIYATVIAAGGAGAGTVS